MRSPMRPNPSAPSQSVGALTKSLLVVEVRAAAACGEIIDTKPVLNGVTEPTKPCIAETIRSTPRPWA